MKKILIATVCAFSLCLTACASKEAPVEKAQIEAPQTESTEAAEENKENSEDSEAQQLETGAEADTGASAEEEADLPAEEYPEPESFEEPDIITLEPVEETVPVIEEPAAEDFEQFEQEEPPVISVPEVSLPSTSEADLSQGENDTGVSGENAEADNDVITSAENGIDIIEDDSDSGEEYIEKEEVIIPSRSVTLKKFEYLDITYPGTGWIYMGITDNSKDLTYFGRKLGTKDTQFSLQARAAGTKIVHFYRNDPLTVNYLDDYIEIIILPENGSNKTHIQAPEYKLPVQKKETPAEAPAEAVEEKVTADTAKEAAKEAQKTTAATPATTPATPKAQAETKNTAAKETAAEEDEVVTVDTTPALPDSGSLLQEAKVLYNEKEYAAALKKLNQFFEYSTDNRDEALYLQGQILEAKSEVRDIKAAIDAYTSLTKNYPASKLWDSANKRIIYLKRFYLEVR